MPTPSKMKVGVFQVSSSADRNAAGTVLIDRVAIKRKIECEWARLTPANLSTLLTAAQVGASSTTPFFSVTYLDPVTNASKTMTMYAGDISVGVYKSDGTTPVYVDTKFSFIEQ